MNRVLVEEKVVYPVVLLGSKLCTWTQVAHTLDQRR